MEKITGNRKCVMKKEVLKTVGEGLKILMTIKGKRNWLNLKY